MNFRIDPEGGRVFVKNALDRERVAKHEVLILAIDEGTLVKHRIKRTFNNFLTCDKCVCVCVFVILCVLTMYLQVFVSRFLIQCDCRGTTIDRNCDTDS